MRGLGEGERCVQAAVGGGGAHKNLGGEEGGKKSTTIAPPACENGFQEFLETSNFECGFQEFLERKVPRIKGLFLPWRSRSCGATTSKNKPTTRVE